MLDGIDGIEVVGDAPDGEAGLQLAIPCRPGVGLTAPLRTEHPPTSVVVVTTHETTLTSFAPSTRVPRDTS